MADEKDEGCVGRAQMVAPGLCVVHEDDHTDSMNIAFPVREGQPLPPGARLFRRTEDGGARVVYDPPEAKRVREEMRAQAREDEAASRSSGGPAMVSSKAFRSGWERTFGGQPN